MDIVNTAQAEAWNGYEGEHWADHHDRYDAVNNGFDGVLLDAAAIGAHDRVLDLGCGSGYITRRAARRAPLGRALGVDLSAPMLARARSLTERDGVPNAEFEQGDAQVHPFPDAAFDAAVSRFGVMFFADPVAAFGNVRRALRDGGRLAFLAMASPAGTDLGTVFAAIGPRPAAVTGHAGPMSMSDPDRVRAILDAAGFRDVSCRTVHAEQVWGRDAADAAEFLAGWGPVRHNLGDGPELRAAITDAMRPFERDGAVRLRGTALLVQARR
ncbi:class I SAM-dependent methyltransferase [Actinomadura physcomitrii]|nr:class I SAM-dependent methyltransferase [Actinomadura physcomitrii]